MFTIRCLRYFIYFSVDFFPPFRLVWKNALEKRNLFRNQLRRVFCLIFSTNKRILIINSLLAFSIIFEIKIFFCQTNRTVISIIIKLFSITNKSFCFICSEFYKMSEVQKSFLQRSVSGWKIYNEMKDLYAQNREKNIIFGIFTFVELIFTLLFVQTSWLWFS